MTPTIHWPTNHSPITLPDPPDPPNLTFYPLYSGAHSRGSFRWPHGDQLVCPGLSWTARNCPELSDQFHQMWCRLVMVLSFTNDRKGIAKITNPTSKYLGFSFTLSFGFIFASFSGRPILFFLVGQSLGIICCFIRQFVGNGEELSRLPSLITKATQSITFTKLIFFFVIFKSLFHFAANGGKL